MPINYLLESFFLSLLLLSCISIPPFVTNQYSQPLPILLLLLFTLYNIFRVTNRFLLRYKEIFGTVLLLVFSIALHSKISISLSLSYIISAVLFSIGIQLAIHYSSLLPSGYRKFIFATSSIPFVIFVSICLDYIFPGFLDFFKGNPSLSEQFLTLRSKSGILPEPSYVGQACALSFLFLSCQIQVLRSRLSIAIDSGKYLIFNFTFSLLSIAISLSPSSIISSLGYFVIAFFTGIFDSYIKEILAILRNFRLSSSTFKNIIIFAAIAFAIFVYYQSRNSSRIQSIISSLLSGSFSLNSDESIVDRSLSSVFGITTPLVQPFGYGVNGFLEAVNNCDKNFAINFLQINCYQAVSSRNHNLIANFSQDFGFFGVFYLMYISNLLTFRIDRRFLLVFAFFFWGLLTPNSLVSVLYWFTLAFLSRLSYTDQFN